MTIMDLPTRFPTPGVDRRDPPIQLSGPIRAHAADSLDAFEGELPLFDDSQDVPDAVIISDLHLGADNCQAKPAATFLQQILDGTLRTRRLIINGDFFDSIDFRRLKKSHWKVLSQIRHLSDKLDVVWIAGNHDGSADIVSQLLGVQVVEEFVLHSGRETILIVHGHQFDDFINDHPVITALADAGYWLLQKFDRSHRIARLAKKRSKIFVRCTNKIRDGARELALSRGCTVAICGHTHQVESVAASTDMPVIYHNSGCWTETPSSYLTVHAGLVAMHSYALVAPEVMATA